ncbi:MAG: sugar phosphate isomerase/epimerase family protein [Clostridia bacterium]|nr:sugar phosphate isomerase/epimerase family protein [Clostridia bacterium]
MKLGFFVSIDTDGSIDEKFRELKDMGFTTCQLNSWLPEKRTDENAAAVIAAKEKYGIEITALWCGWSGPCKWNFTEGPATLGLVPTAYRYDRFKELKSGCDFAVKIGVTDVITHMGFLPENPCTSEYLDLVASIRALAEYFKEKGRYLLFETGQETPVTLLRTIERVGTGNLGINFDTANLIVYGKANSADALDVFGKYVRNTHIKDGTYPPNGDELGDCVPLGEGRANLPVVLKKLHDIGYRGPLTIEHEVTTQEMRDGMLAAKAYVENLLKELDIEF